MDKEKMLHDLAILYMSKQHIASQDPAFYLESYLNTIKKFKDLFDDVSEEEYQKFASKF